MAFPQSFCGYQRVTTSGTIGIASKPAICYGYSVLSGAGGVAQPWFIDGAATGGTIAFIADPSSGAASKERTITIPIGTTFSTQIYVSFDANTTAVTVFYTENF